MAQHTTPIGRVSFPQVFQAEQIQGEGDHKFRLTMVFEPDAPGLKEMEALVERAIKDKWPDKTPSNLQHPLIDGDTMDNRPEYAGKIIARFSAKENRQPQVVDHQVQTITERSGQFYSGCYAKVRYTVYAWSYLGKNGVSFGLGNIQKVGDGEAFDGRTRAEDDFEVVTEDELV